MAEQVKYIQEPLGGLRLDVPSTLMRDSFSTECLNIRVLADSIAGRDGTSALGGNLPLAESTMAVRQFRTFDKDVHTVAITEDDIYELDIDDNWTSILGSASWDCDLSLPVRTAFINNTLVITNGNNELLEWDGEASTVSTVANSSDYRAADLHAFYYRMVYAGMTESGNPVPQRVRWTEIGTYDNFTDGYATYVDLVDTPGAIMAAEKLGGSLVIYKDDSIVLANYIGGKNVFSFETRVSDIGLVAPRAVVNLGDRHLFLAHDNVYEFTGGRSVQPVGDAIQSEMPRLVSGSYIDRSIAIRFGDEALFFVPVDEDTPDTTYVYNWRTDQWYKYSLGAIGVGTYYETDIVTIGDLEGTIGALGGRIGDYGSVSIRPRIVLGDTDGNIYTMEATANTDAGEAIENRWDSKDFTLGEEYKTRYNRFRYMELDAKGDNVDVYYSLDGGDSWSLIGTAELSDTYEWHRLWFDDTGRQIRLRFENINAGENFSLRTFKIAYREGAER